MGTYINVGNAGFQRARNSEYVDKSMLISVINKTLFTERQYPAKVAQYTDNLLLVGISYDRETKQHSCHTEIVKAAI